MFKKIKKFLGNRYKGRLDKKFYAAWYTDLTNLSDEQLAKHWQRIGRKEGRYPNFHSLLKKCRISLADLPPDFDWSFYCNNYWDLKDAGINNRFKAVHHYLLYGKNEGRLYAPQNEFQKKHLCQFPDINEQAVDAILDEIRINPGVAAIDEYLSASLQQFWREQDKELTALAVKHAYEGVDNKLVLLEETDKAVKFIADAYRKEYLTLSEALQKPINSRRVLIIGDFFLPQCIRYRIEQKLEQLATAGYAAKAVSWTDAQKMEHALAFHDVVIFYRVPALPDIVKMIVQARVLGKLTFYEIDDLLFEPLYPPPIETYGGYVTPEVYVGLTKGMALFHSAAKLCEFAIASTQPLATRLGRLVESGRCYVHRNGLDAQNRFHTQVQKQQEHIDIFYGSGTKAHNSDFIALAVPALERILEKYPHVRLVIVGYLELPQQFLEKFSNQTVTIPLVDNLQNYWSLLSHADINLAVLLRDEINDCKSELKWFEAACFSIPSVVSKTENYAQVIRQNDDGIMVESSEEWFYALEALLNDPVKRAAIGARAHQRVIADYSVATLADNIDAIIRSALHERAVTLQNRQRLASTPHA
ncbi:MAG: glycosyltransferase family protein [Gammaproteobacteria bacterium]